MSLESVKYVKVDSKEEIEPFEIAEVKCDSKEEKEPFEITMVKYELNTVENLKKAKENVNRSGEITRNVINDTNIRFDLQSGLYLEIKRKSLSLNKGDKFYDKDIGVEIKVTSLRRTITKVKKESPQSSIYFEVKYEGNNTVTNCVQHMYHTKQSIHLQGGQRSNGVTTTSLLADVLEKQWKELKEVKREDIAKYSEAIAKIDLLQYKEEMEVKKSQSQGQRNTSVTSAILKVILSIKLKDIRIWFTNQNQ